MSQYWYLSGDANGSRVKGFTTAGKNGKTTLRVEIEVTDPWEVGSLLRQLQEAQCPRPAVRTASDNAPPEPQPTRLTRTLALPAPSQRKS